jgi:hypothetical protein
VLTLILEGSYLADSVQTKRGPQNVYTLQHTNNLLVYLRYFNNGYLRAFPKLNRRYSNKLFKQPRRLQPYGPSRPVTGIALPFYLLPYLLLLLL